MEATIKLIIALFLESISEATKFAFVDHFRKLFFSIQHF